MSDAPQIDAALDAIRRAIQPSTVSGIYLYGSAVAGGLRPDSDLDLFVLVRRRLTRVEKRRMISALRPISRRSLRPAGWRPLEVTVVAQPDLQPWRHPARHDLQYGEWLDDDQLQAAVEDGPIENPDLGVVVEMVRSIGRPLIGPPASEVLDPVPRADVVRAMLDEVPSLLDDLADDTRNVLLTLARMWCTVATGAMLPKDAAAEWAIARLPAPHQPPLARARELYLGGGYGSWDPDTVRGIADWLADRIGSEAASGSAGRR